MSCAGVQIRGGWRGSACRAVAKYTLRGKQYCGAHLAVARDEPERFKEAGRAEERRVVREHRKVKLQLEARRQLDAFETTEGV